jgi:uncharacterized protein YjbI with pentapeptide repeats
LFNHIFALYCAELKGIKMARSINILHRDGRVVYQGDEENYAQALLSYASAGGDLRALNHSNRDLSNITFPEGADMSGSDFTGTKMRWIRANDVNFSECQFRRAYANNATMVNCSFDRSEIVNSNFDRANFKECSFVESAIIRSMFRYAGGYKLDFTGASISNTSFLHADIPISKFTNSRISGGDLMGVKFSTKRFSGREGKKIKQSALAGNKSDAKTVAWLDSLYKDAKFIACKYSDDTVIPTATKIFPREIFYQRAFLGISKVALTIAGFEIVDRAVGVLQDSYNNPTFRNHVLEHIIPYLSHLSPESVVYMGGAVLLGAVLAGDNLKERMSKSGEEAAMRGWRRAIDFKSRVSDLTRDLASLAIVAGKRRTMRPIIAALMTVSKRRGGDERWNGLTQSIWQIARGGDRIVICSRDDLKRAMGLLHNIECKTTFPFDHPITIISDQQHDVNAPMAISMRPDRRIKVIWSIADSKFSGHLMQSWDGSEKKIKLMAKPELDAHEIEALLSRHPEIAEQISHGPGACMRMMINDVSQAQASTALSSGDNAENLAVSPIISPTICPFPAQPIHI